MIEELGDLEFYMEGIRQQFNITREVTILHNIEKLNKRYNKMKYTNEDAKLRVDKVD